MTTEVNSFYYYGSLAAWIVIIQVVGGITGYFIKDEIENWYKKINRAPLNPPDWVFPIAWTILYVLIAVSGWRLQFAQSTAEINVIRALFGVQLILNWIWSPIFFISHKTGLSFAIIITMDLLVVATIVLSFLNLTVVQWLMIPYLLWICFASYLNFYVWRNNEEGEVQEKQEELRDSLS